MDDGCTSDQCRPSHSSRKNSEKRGKQEGIAARSYVDSESTPMVCPVIERVIDLLLFNCSHCTKMIAAVDSESTDQIVDKLVELHVATPIDVK